MRFLIFDVSVLVCASVCVCADRLNNTLLLLPPPGQLSRGWNSSSKD